MRTEEERERDRAERARRRATGSPPVAEAVEVPLPPPVMPVPIPPSASPRPPVESQPVAPPPVAAPPIAPPPVPPSRTAAPRRHGHSPFARALALLALVIVALGAWLAIERLTKAKPAAKPIAALAIVRVLIPEGETRLQIAARAHAAGLRGSYLTASKRSALLDPAHYGAPAGTPDLEGFLFPATYDLYRGDPTSRLVHEQLIAFGENFGAEVLRRARELHITPYQLLVVASMVEREAQLPGDRAKVAAVIYNRLRLNMALGIDSTIRYALNDYTQPLTAAQLQLDSPYNTRTHHGLPPTPISNPGDAAIAAAAHPAHVPYLYYVAGADGCGELVFSTSSAQFERDAAAYRDALASSGGRVPTCRKRS